MPSYRGVNQSDVLKSIQEGLALLEHYSPGAECQKRIDAIRAADPASGVSSLDGITAAKDDNELAVAVRKCGATYLFNRLRGVMEYHALNDTDGVGLKVFENLSSFGAFSGAMTAEYNGLDKEEQLWLLRSCARRIANGQASVPLKDRFTLWAMALQPEQRAKISTGKALLKKAVACAEKDGTDQVVIDYFQTLALNERHVLLGMAQIMAGMNPDRLADKNPISRYGVVIDSLRDKKVNWKDPAITAIREEVEKTLEPFWDTDEVDIIGVGCLTERFSKKAPQGIMFGASRRAAEAVAGAMPGYRVIDSKGKHVAPLRHKQRHKRPPNLRRCDPKTKG